MIRDSLSFAWKQVCC